MSATPDFAGSASVVANSDVVTLGPGTGNVTVGGGSLDPASEATLTGYTGTIGVTAAGGTTDKLVLDGNAAQVLQVTGGTATLTTDQNTPLAFALSVQTSLADTYTLGVTAPPGWTTSVDAGGTVTVIPASGLPGGTYPIRLYAQSTTDPDLIAQGVVEVTVTPTQPGLALLVTPDTLHTLPFNGAQLPTLFLASLHNDGPGADSFGLSFSGVSPGFTVLASTAGVTIPAGGTSIAGVTLLPTGLLPPPGAQGTFTVTATSTTNPAITQTETVTFTIPTLDAVTVTADPATVNATPGAAVGTTFTVSDVGNEPEAVALALSGPSGLTFSNLATLLLEPGQSATESGTLTPDPATPLGSTLGATLTATFGPDAAPLTTTLSIAVNVVVPGADVIATAAGVANQLGDADLADRLDDLSGALTALVLDPANAVVQSQAEGSLNTIIGLLASDADLTALVPALTADAAALAQVTSIADVETTAANLSHDLATLSTTLTDLAAHQFTLTLEPNNQAGQPQTPTTYQVALQNTGNQTTTYDLSLAGLPAGVTGTLSPSSITLAPGQSTPGSSGVPAVFLTLTSDSPTQLAPFGFTVQADAENAAEISRTASGAFTPRNTLVQVIAVTTNPTFTSSGSQVDVTAQILNAVNQEQQVRVSYTVTDASGKVVFTSPPVATTLDVLATLSTVDLGNLDTIGFALGDDTINVTVSDAAGNPIAGATGTGTLLIGTPVTATLSTTPSTLPPGSGTVTTTLQVNSQLSYSTSPLTTEGLKQIANTSSLALDGTLAYIGTVGGIDVVDVSDPTHPQGPGPLQRRPSLDLAGAAVVAMQVYNGELVVLAGPASTPTSSLLVYSLATPSNPTLPGL